MELKGSFKYMGTCFSKYGGSECVLKMKLGEGRKTFIVLTMMFHVRSVSLTVKRGIHERYKLDVVEVKFLWIRCAGTSMDGPRI